MSCLLLNWPLFIQSSNFHRWLIVCYNLPLDQFLINQFSSIGELNSVQLMLYGAINSRKVVYCLLTGCSTFENRLILIRVNIKEINKPIK